MLQSVLDLISQSREEAIALQRLLVSIPALAPENGGQGEKDKAEALKAFLEKWGFSAPTELRAPDPRVPCGYRPSLVYRLMGEDTSRTFWILSHLDVVPVGERALWKTDPFALTVEGDFIFGRGVEDNHQGLVSSVLLAKALLDQKAKPPFNLGLLLVADEECGNVFGLEHIMKHHADLFGANDLFLVPDHGAADGTEIEIAEKGVLWLKITINGQQCHASMPDKGVNALRAGAAMIVRLEGVKERFPASDPLFSPPVSTFEPTKKEANVENINTLPGRDVFYLDCRVLPCYPLDDVLASIKAIGAEIEKERGVSVSYDIVQKMNAAPSTAPDSEIVARLQKALREELRREARLTGIGGGTFAALLRRKGFPAAVWSTLLGMAHQPNEKASLSATLQDARLMARALFAEKWSG